MPPGKSTVLESMRKKEFDITTKLTDKNVEKMLKDGEVDPEMGISIPGSKAVAVKEEDDEVAKVKQMVADLKPT